MIFSTLVSLLALTLGTTSSPIGPQSLIVVTPHITSPTEAVSWAPGSVQTVTWETKSIPTAYKNNTGMILLGHLSETYDSKGERPHPLANHFMIGDGHANVTIPIDTPSRSDYIVVLFGDSGNASPKFMIAKK
ncbi:hypothetical protein B0H15DRAFT_798219 [Mycena belliarum]|uniref:Purple acid phosphatase N-terminal domain-containing protein n=1 Tax=Mycena belliarum TaxID=1033014 RepID=A0AAD6UA25_9AGAR|nr:hypothetical protein B0H15DRAFT_798219 [Mycena belliae]